MLDKIVALIAIVLIFTGCTQEKVPKLCSSIESNINFTYSDILNLKQLHKSLAEPNPGEWLYTQLEPGQSFQSYINSNPICPTSEKNKIYLLPIGKFDSIDLWVIEEVQKYISIFFELKVALLPTLKDSVIPDNSKRFHLGSEQWHTSFFINKLLINNFPNDAIAFMALSSNDLYPKESWNFVFGQAHLKNRVGVSSIFRLKPSASDNQSKNLYLKRVLRTASHELSHMFSIKHCKQYKCLMNGSISLSEADSKPLWPCPQCFAKIAWFTQFNLINRMDSLDFFFETHSMKNESLFYKNSKAILLSRQ